MLDVDQLSLVGVTVFDWVIVKIHTKYAFHFYLIIIFCLMTLLSLLIEVILTKMPYEKVNTAIPNNYSQIFYYYFTGKIENLFLYKNILLLVGDNIYLHSLFVGRKDRRSFNHIISCL